MKLNKKSIFEIALIAVIILTVAFIFSRSAKSKEQSSAESDAVGEIVDEIISDDVPQKDFIVINIRKIAHFIEFSILGAELAAYVLIFRKKSLFIVSSYVLGLILAFLDETVQVFSKRGPSIIDVWIDFFGLFITASLVYLSFLISILIMRRVRRGLGGKSDG